MAEHVMILKKANCFKDTEYLYQCTFGKILIGTEHKHDFYEMIYVYSGECVQVINGKCHSMRHGDAILLNIGDSHYFREQMENTNIVSLSISKKEFEKYVFLYSIDLHNSFNTMFYVPSNELFEINFLYANQFYDPMKREMFCRLMLSKILGYRQLEICGYTLQNTSLKSFPEFVDAVSKMNRLENAKEGMEAFIRLSNYSRAQLTRLTNQYMNISPKEYINNIRLRYAFDAVVYTDKNYGDIADMVGFSSISHFRTIFKRKYHMTLKQARMNGMSKNRTV